MDASSLPHEMNELGQRVGIAVDQWESRPYPPHISLQGQYCQLIPIDATQHTLQLFEAYANDTDHKNWTYLPCGPFSHLEDFQLWINSTCLTNDPLFYTIFNQNKQAVGVASYLRITPDIGNIEVGHIHFSPLMQKTPMATEAMYLMMKHVFEDLGYRRYEWKCNALNESSRNAALRLGFSFEGIFRQAAVVKHRNRDTAWFSILDHEWPKMKQAFESWLQADNFDDSGQQVKRLSDFR